MQAYALTIDKFLAHAAKWHGDVEIISASGSGAPQRIGYAALCERANRLSGAFLALGVSPGECVATLAWNTQAHMEAYYAAMGAGLICHTLNPRLTPAHLSEMINLAEDRVLAVAANLAPLVSELLPLCPGVEHVIWLDEPSSIQSCKRQPDVKFWDYDTLLLELGRETAWGQFDENQPAGLCFTSGTTGKPKGVLYTHRSNYLHTLRALQADAVALTGQETLLVAVPMFHANGWGLPFAAPAVGAKLVLPGRQADGASLARLMRDERVTLAAGVQTVWLGLLDHLDETGEDLPDLKRILIGGSKCPASLIERMQTRLGVTVQTSWGMTELSPVGAIAPPGMADGMTETAGLAPMGLDLLLTDAQGQPLPVQRNVTGHLKVRGHSVVGEYFKSGGSALDENGYFDTGDLAVIDSQGRLTITGRSKDLIKSGGEWINPAEIEDIVGRQPEISQVAVIGKSDPKWGERPILVVEPSLGHSPDTQSLRQLLKGHVADWWIPDEMIVVEAMPLAPTGKIDKRKLRRDYSS
ncbi:MAG: AMP-dependent synthetase [Oceanicaulis sp.]|uniref:AMP-binding protein n=1 Tax=unclassified Oceanicaulis TaxID=2632123 RepID=UPI000C4E9DBB|nr:MULTISPECIES: AMP-binding protein [unclassified Oceanicaulis]MBC38091.1 AMP-dependent synthetase [Oceanicaulis sp.]MBG34957.1 AMP-dependent synthetase [Oceanicaulis sp.]HBU62789.1 AMP-dependent synthetase [Oceanicaulis sp.]